MHTLANEQHLDWIVFHGGEPFLFYKTLKRCIEIARRLGQKEIAIITNGYWGGNQTNAQSKLQELKKAGLTSIYFSVDAFHQEFIPVRSVRTAINAARTVGFDKMTVTSQFLEPHNPTNRYDAKTERCLERLRLPDDFKIDRHRLNVEGRAADQLAGFLKQKTGIPNGKCVLPYWAGKTLENPKTIEIDFLGNVTICPGLCIGNAKTKSLSKILSDYDYRSHPITKLLAEYGPYKLCVFPETKNMVSRGKCVSECHLCYEMRSRLRGRFPELLTPDNCYNEQ